LSSVLLSLIHSKTEHPIALLAMVFLYLTIAVAIHAPRSYHPLSISNRLKTSTSRTSHPASLSRFCFQISSIIQFVNWIISASTVIPTTYANSTNREVVRLLLRTLDISGDGNYIHFGKFIEEKWTPQWETRPEMTVMVMCWIHSKRCGVSTRCAPQWELRKKNRQKNGKTFTARHGCTLVRSKSANWRDRAWGYEWRRRNNSVLFEERGVTKVALQTWVQDWTPIIYVCPKDWPTPFTQPFPTEFCPLPRMTPLLFIISCRLEHR